MQAMPAQAQGETILQGIQPDEIETYLPHIRPLLATVIDRVREIDEASLLRRIKSANSQCWIIHNQAEIICVGISTLVTSGSVDICIVAYLAGKHGRMDDWLHHLEEIKEFARAHDCEILRIVGREGWKRVIKHDACRVQLDIEL